MVSIIAYQKERDQYTEYVLDAPEGSQELCTLGTTTYVSIPDGKTIGPQPDQIVASIRVVEPDQQLRDQISDASPYVKLIRARVRDMIAERYSIEDEIKLLRTAPSDEFEDYNAYAESCRAWGRVMKSELGL